jgi:hypothetical protein
VPPTEGAPARSARDVPVAELADAIYTGLLGRPRGSAAPEDEAFIAHAVSESELARAFHLVVASDEFVQHYRQIRLVTYRDRPPTQLHFDHIPKTGGRSLLAHLRELARGPILDAVGLEDVLTTPLATLLGAHVIAGHHGCGMDDWLPWLRPRRMTVLRHPLPRLVSQYLHLRREIGGGELERQALQTRAHLPFEQWYDYRLERGENNTMALWLTERLVPDTTHDGVDAHGRARWGLPGLLDQSGLLPRAEQALSGRAILGVIEELEPIQRQLERWFRVNVESGIQRLNEGRGTSDLLASLSGSARTKLEQAEEIDLLLWDRARVEARARAHSGGD